jgi:hypothetical protein
MLWPTFQNVPQQACLLHRQGFPGPLERLLLFASVRIDLNVAPLLGLCFPVLLVYQDLSLAGSQHLAGVVGTSCWGSLFALVWVMQRRLALTEWQLWVGGGWREVVGCCPVSRKAVGHE